MNTKIMPEPSLLYLALAMAADLLTVYRSRDRELIRYVEDNSISVDLHRALLYLSDPSEGIRAEGAKIIGRLSDDGNIFRRTAGSGIAV